ncbi:carbohydrate ABC transporter permease [Schleiferilactobacillus harbinensis]|uniref:carbohydrate ABC transporter permease n=1 Tax=Schleiferilactobacillus harbinensis TaxID=304207 RepID=UPI00345E90DD
MAFTFIPHSLSLAAYQILFEGKQIFMSYGVTIFLTVVGTLLSLILSAMMTHPLSTGRLKLGNTINFLVYFTMLFGAGLVPSCLLISKQPHMNNTIWVLIIPGVISPRNMFLLRNFFSSIPRSLSESAEMDGAPEMTILFKIILPVAKPALATIGLFSALGYWNTWFGALIYIFDPNLYPLQFLIMKNVETIQEAARQGVPFPQPICRISLPRWTPLWSPLAPLSYSIHLSRNTSLLVWRWCSRPRI